MADPKRFSSESQKLWAKEMLAFRTASEPRSWETQARPKQLPPDHPRHHLPDEKGFRCGCAAPSPDWTTWIFLAGRGTGKTRAGAEWVMSMAMSEGGIYVGVCGPTYADVKNTCFENLKSGIIACARPGEIADYNRNDLRITTSNGSIIQGFSAEKAESVRGANLSYCWFDELAMIRYIRFYDYGLKPALRIRPAAGHEPRLMITTTPKKMKLIRKLVKQAQTDPDKVHVTSARSEENPYFSSGALADLRREYKGTYLERQELEGELIEEADGALFRIEDFAEFRIEPGSEPEFRRIVVAIDPATTSSDQSDESGIIVAAEGVNHHFYTLDDLSFRGSPEETMKMVARAFRQYDADLVVCEKNSGGDYLPTVLSHVDPNIPMKMIPAMKGKQIRAQPISILAATGRIHMTGTGFDKLEEQLASLTGEDDRSAMHDDRADAWVWAMRELSGAGGGNYEEAYGFAACEDCAETVHSSDKRCKNCGKEIIREKAKERDRSTRWSAAYQKTCENGHDYPMRMKRCPECSGDPEAYLGQVMKLSSRATGGMGYAGRNWLAGRNI